MRMIWAAVLLFTVTACGSESREAPAVVAFGHSFVAGTDDVEPWVDRLAADVGLPVENRADGGTESPDTLERVQDYTFLAGDLVVIEAMLNDVRRLGANGCARYIDNVTKMLDVIRSTPDVTVVVVGDPPIVPWDEHPPHDQGSTDILTACTVRAENAVAGAGANFIDLAAEWDLGTMVMEDGIHPNDVGADHIAEIVAATI